LSKRQEVMKMRVLWRYLDSSGRGSSDTAVGHEARHDDAVHVQGIQLCLERRVLERVAVVLVDEVVGGERCQGGMQFPAVRSPPPAPCHWNAGYFIIFKMSIIEEM